MHFSVSRRVLLTAGVGGASLGLLTACGLRIDSDPDIPTLNSSQRLRNRIARILAATSPATEDPDTAGEDLAAFTAAIGAEWNPPTEFATESPSAEEDRSFVSAAEVVARAVFEASSSLGAGLIPVLTDVATGLTLVAGQKRPELIDTADELIRAGRQEIDEGAGRSAPASSSSQDLTAMFNTILDQARAAAYSYERLAVNFSANSAERTGALARLESLGSLSGEMLEILGEKQADPNASAWKLDPTPTDAESAKELALNLEDGLASAILPWLADDPAAILRLWESARARTVFSAPQPLRYSYDDSGQAEAKK